MNLKLSQVAKTISSSVGPSSSRPTIPPNSLIFYFDETLGKLLFGKAGHWYDVSTGNQVADYSAVVYNFLPGINISGAEFGIGGYSYVYPDHARIDDYAARGFKLIRVPFLSKNMFTRSGTTPAFSTNSTTNTKDIDILEDIIQYAATKNIIILIDMHDYDLNDIGIIGVTTNAQPLFVNQWVLLANKFKVYTNVRFGLMNEPNRSDPPNGGGSAMTASVAASFQLAAINAIRSAGATSQIIHVNGTDYSGAHSWDDSKSGNASAFAQFDSVPNVVIEAHQYGDNNHSGSHYDDASLSTDSVTDQFAPFINWLKAGNRRGFIGEFGFSANPQNINMLKSYLTLMRTNKWNGPGTGGLEGWAYWSSGAYWPDDYGFLAEARPFPNGTIPPQLTLLQREATGTTLPLTITGTPALSGMVGDSVSFIVKAQGGVPNWTYSIGSGSLPAGLSINSVTGVVSGTLTTAGTQNGIIIRVTDSLGTTKDLASFNFTTSANTRPAWVYSSAAYDGDFVNNRYYGLSSLSDFAVRTAGLSRDATGIKADTNIYTPQNDLATLMSGSTGTVMVELTNYSVSGGEFVITRPAIRVNYGNNNSFLAFTGAPLYHSVNNTSGSGNNTNVQKVIMSWDANGYSICANGSDASSSTEVIGPLNYDHIYLGSEDGTNNPIFNSTYNNARIRRITAWVGRLSNAQMKTISGS